MPVYSNPILEAAAIDDQTDPGLLRRLANTGLSGVSAVGNVLDLPGSSVRDLLAFHNPLDQWLPWNWTSSEGRTSGRDLLRQYGLAGKEDTYGNWWAGFAGEIATDPLTWLGAGALIKGAQAGTTGARGLLRAGVPLTKYGVELGTGARAEAVARGLGSVGDYLTKPSVLAPGLESSGKYLTSKLPGVKAASEAAKGIDFTRTYLPPKKTSRADFLRTKSLETLQKERSALQEKIAGLGNDVSVADAEELTRYDLELAARAAGSQPIDLMDLRKSGELGRVDISPQSVNAVESIVPKTPAPVAPWAVKGAEFLTAPARAAQMLFHAPVRGKFGEEAQRVARAQWERIGKAHQEAREEATKFVDDYHEIEKGVSDAFGTDMAAMLPADLSKSVANVAKHVRDTTERLFGMAAETDDVAGTVREFGLDPSKAPDLLDKIGFLSRRMKDVNQSIYKSYLEMGGTGEIIPKLEADEIPELAEIGGFPGFEHFPRFGAEHPDNVLAAIRGGSTRAPGSIARHEALRAVPREIVERIGKMVQEVRSQGMGEKAASEAIADKYGKWLNRETVDVVLEDGEIETVAKWGSVEKHAQELAKWGMNASNYATYLNHNLKAESRYLRGLFTATANMAAIYDVLKTTVGRRPLEVALPDEALPKGTKQLRGLLDATQELGPEVPTMPIAEMFDKAGMDVNKSLAWLAKQYGDTSEEGVKQLLDHGAVPRAVAEAIIGSRKVTQIPEWAQTLARITDIPTRWFKENVTLPFLSFATRNLASGQYLAGASGVLESLDDLKAYGQEVAAAFEAFRTGNIPTERQREWFVNGVLHEDMLFEGVETRMGQFGHVAPDPIDPRAAWFEAGQQIEPNALDKIPGFGPALRTARQVHGTVLNTGAKVNRFVEYLNRVPLYEALKKKGWTPEQAARKVAELQVDYSAHQFSPFENEVIRRLVPFYSWQRKVGPVILGSLARNPAGPMGLTIRGSRLASSDDPRVPEWLSDTLAIENPFGSTEEGGQSYFTGFGLPYEPVLSFFGGGLRGAGREFLSQLNPLIKAPLEWSTGQSFFQAGPSGGGRPLEEMNPPIGQTLANVARFAGRDPSTPVPTPAGLEFVAANSPLTRYITTARQITDPRKHPASLALNLLTGVRAADISPQAQDAILRQRAATLMRGLGARQFSQTYFPDEHNMTPQNRALAEQLEELQKLLAKRSRARKKQPSA